MSSGTGTCSVTATKAADTNYNSTTSVAATVAATLANQTTLDGNWCASNAASVSGNVHGGLSRRQRDRRVDVRGERSVHEHSRWSFNHDELGHGHVLSDCDQGSRHKLQQRDVRCINSGRDTGESSSADGDWCAGNAASLSGNVHGGAQQAAAGRAR